MTCWMTRSPTCLERQARTSPYARTPTVSRRGIRRRCQGDNRPAVARAKSDRAGADIEDQALMGARRVDPLATRRSFAADES
jgi:hypothetical protein